MESDVKMSPLHNCKTHELQTQDLSVLLKYTVFTTYFIHFKRVCITEGALCVAKRLPGFQSGL
jgi:hypothetical protein